MGGHEIDCEKKWTGYFICLGVKKEIQASPLHPLRRSAIVIAVCVGWGHQVDAAYVCV